MAKGNREVKAGDEVLAGNQSGIALPSDAASGEVIVVRPLPTEIVMPENFLPADVTPCVAQKATALIDFPLVCLPDGGAVQRGFHFNLNFAQARKLKQLRMSLHESGATYHDGRIRRHVDRAHDVFGWLLDQIEVA